MGEVVDLGRLREECPARTDAAEPSGGIAVQIVKIDHLIAAITMRLRDLEIRRRVLLTEWHCLDQEGLISDGRTFLARSAFAVPRQNVSAQLAVADVIPPPDPTHR